MVGHIKEIAEALIHSLNERGSRVPLDVLRTLVEVLEGLNVSDFAAGARAEFLLVRSSLKRWAETGAPLTGNTASERINEAELVIKLLDVYGPLALPSPRDFRWLLDADLKKIVERDYKELHSLVMPNGAWKSALVMAGSITEAILFALIVKDTTRLSAAQGNPAWPKRRTGAPKTADDLSLADLIKLATVVGLLESSDEETFDRVLRNYRNFIHPTREVSDERDCTEGRALMAKGALDALCDTLDRTL